MLKFLYFERKYKYFFVLLLYFLRKKFKILIQLNSKEPNRTIKRNSKNDNEFENLNTYYINKHNYFYIVFKIEELNNI